MEKAYSLNRIERRKDGKKEVVPPKEVFDASKTELARLVAMSAARLATDEEIDAAAAKAERAAGKKPAPAKSSNGPKTGNSKAGKNAGAEGTDGSNTGGGSNSGEGSGGQGGEDI